MIRCTFENGHEAFLRHVTVDGLVLNDENRLLLVKRSDSASVEPGKWVLPGGYLERDESTAEGVMRETKEESGYETEVVTLFRILDTPHRKGDDRQNVSFFYWLRPVTDTGERDDEVSEVEWFGLDELPKLGFDHGETIDLLKRHLEQPFALPIMNEKHE